MRGCIPKPRTKTNSLTAFDRVFCHSNKQISQGIYLRLKNRMNEADFPSLEKNCHSQWTFRVISKLKSNQNRKMQLIFSKSRYKLSAYEFTVLESTVNQEGQHTSGCGEDLHRGQEHFNDRVRTFSSLQSFLPSEFLYGVHDDPGAM